MLSLPFESSSDFMSKSSREELSSRGSAARCSVFGAFLACTEIVSSLLLSLAEILSRYREICASSYFYDWSKMALISAIILAARGFSLASSTTSPSFSIICTR